MQTFYKKTLATISFFKGHRNAQISFYFTGMKLCLSLALLLCLSCTAFAQTKTNDLQWFRGNLHTHSLWSDGDGYPDMIVDWYQSNGYHFVALSDHNILAQGEKWVKVPKSKLHEEAFQNYLRRFGDEWVEQKSDSTGRISVRLKTYDEYRKRFEKNDFIMLRSEEVTDQFEKKPIHMNVTNVQELIPPQGGKSVSDVMQRNINAVLDQRSKAGVAMFPHINHPNFYYAISVDDMISLRGERFFEVYNGHQLVNNEGDSIHLSTEKMWDRINVAYRKRGQDLMFGLATDDSHNYHQFGKSFSNAGRGWVMVRAKQLTPESLIEAMEAGDFYSSTGVELEELKVEKNSFTIGVKQAKGVTYSIEIITANKNGDMNYRIRKGTKTSVALSPEDLFLRARVVSSKKRTNAVNEVEYEMAWTQPVIFSKEK